MYKFNKKHAQIFVALTVIALLILIRQFNKTEQLIDISSPVSDELLYKSDNKLFNLNLEYIVEATKCKATTAIVIIVTSYFGNVETRSAMRRAFSSGNLQELNIQRVFLLGTNNNDKYTKQNAILHEAKRFNDIIQGNFQESYRNLTYKHVMGLKWASSNCVNAKYIIKMDDDIVVNLNELVDILNNTTFPPNNFLAGYVMKNMMAIREKANKWFVTNEEYEEDHYPTFLSGWLYITNPTTAKQLVALTKHHPYFWIDDTYITGILAGIIKIPHVNLNELFAVHSEYITCCIHDVLRYNLDCEFIIGPNGGDNNLFYEFNEVLKRCRDDGCKKRPQRMNETCVAEKKVNVGRGNSVIETYKL